jgi:hypothetical protein
MLRPSVFSEPTAHDVESITAKISVRSDFVALRLILTGREAVTGEKRYGEFQIFAPVSKTKQLEAIAKAINHQFIEDYRDD